MTSRFGERIKLVEGGAFAKVVDATYVKDVCAMCYFFNPHENDPGKGYRCKVRGSCPAVDLSEEQKGRIWHALDAEGGIDGPA